MAIITQVQLQNEQIYDLNDDGKTYVPSKAVFIKPTSINISKVFNSTIAGLLIGLDVIINTQT